MYQQLQCNLADLSGVFQMADISQYVLPNDIGVCLLDCETAFNALTPHERLYSHYLSQACWYGGLIVLIQSPGIYILIQKIFRSQPVEDLQKKALQNGLSEDEFQAFIVYCAGFLSNMGNYKSFGDSKIIPNLPKEKFEMLVMCSAAAQADVVGIQKLWTAVRDNMFSLSDKQRELGLGKKGTTTYFSANCNAEDAKIAQEFMISKDLSPYNTRLFKVEDPQTKQATYQIRLASSEEGAGDVPDCGCILGDHQFKPEGSEAPITFQISRGDYSKLMGLVADNLEKTRKYSSNELERSMLTEYIRSFRTGSIPAHKEGSKFWIKNKGPVVESYIGFIESYRDPNGLRGEFEGFVAVVNKKMSAKFAALVENAEHMLALLPWPVTYEKDQFLRPDFTSLDVLTFGGSGIPAGINIPNYDDIRQDLGFKNVSLGNVLTAGYKDTKITFMQEEDKELYTKLKIPSFEMHVGLHELLGHGSGKLFKQRLEESEQKKKMAHSIFDIDVVTHTETGEKIKSWYKHNETWDTKFSTLSSTYEECRAECVGIYLCLAADVLKIFGHVGKEADDIIYINWLNMARSGLLALEFYSPETRQWRQAHMQARFVILRALLEAGDDLVKIHKFVAEDGKEDIVLTLDRAKIHPVGKPAIGALLRKLQLNDLRTVCHNRALILAIVRSGSLHNCRVNSTGGGAYRAVVVSKFSGECVYRPYYRYLSSYMENVWVVQMMTCCILLALINIPRFPFEYVFSQNSLPPQFSKCTTDQLKHRCEHLKRIRKKTVVSSSGICCCRKRSRLWCVTTI
ncbi:hypothetical protein ScPMuIL_014451 [Solemya velum]